MRSSYGGRSGGGGFGCWWRCGGSWGCWSGGGGRGWRLAADAGDDNAGEGQEEESVAIHFWVEREIERWCVIVGAAWG